MSFGSHTATEQVLTLREDAGWRLIPNARPRVLGLLVWTLIAGTEYFRVPAFGWVMFVAVFYWVLTVFFLIIYITMTYTRIPQVPWTTVGLCFNGSAFALYLSAAIVDASSVSLERDSHNFNSWAASSPLAGEGSATVTLRMPPGLSPPPATVAGSSTGL
ncbi:CKLF-like MARVEL transmembrane domain-containing protein 8 [Camelus ferus]|nr:CKLF-like MARVEL transmembrane domain-containing protein 8 [Camelus ferus]